MKSSRGLPDLRVAHAFEGPASLATQAALRRVLVAVFYRDELFFCDRPPVTASFDWKVREGGTPSPARETHALPSQG